ncbi:cation-transporting P-type ATPase [Melittangium boletus]|uniref:cation-transporting P-type ATPase n=1 Tax=Melittangium boletus TaxID=83453 RepID=UPI002481D2D9|nr:cation-transporting P-type ATPase [Melittangium boletus]
MPPDAVFDSVGSLHDGLSESEARVRLERHGPNVLQRVSDEGPLKLLWRQVNNPFIWGLLAAASLTIALGKVTDSLIVARGGGGRTRGVGDCGAPGLAHCMCAHGPGASAT